ncbi:MAG: FHA domain-containing protein [Oscillochloridaceae bacterium umkhey_bin13]
MPFCPQCGVENPSSARFCDQCGAVMIPVPAQGQALVPAIPVAPATPVAPAAPTGGPVVAGPSNCPQCGSGVIPGEAFCDNCGAALLGPTTPAAPAPSLPYGGVPAQPSYPPPQPVVPATPVAPPRPPTPVAPPPPMVPVSPPPPPARTSLAPSALIIRSSGANVPLPNAAEVMIGRSDPVSNFFPDLDLTPHGALDQGVGRRHARIFVQGGQLYLEDLDSTNGTFRNGARLAPRQPTTLAAGDELRFGSLVTALQL